MKKKIEQDDDLASSIVDAINSKFKSDKAAYIIGAESTPTDLTDFVSSGSSLLDIAVSNRLDGGIVAAGRITELSGLQGSAKSLICAHMMAHVQKSGGICVLIDTENAVNEEFFASIGLSLKKMVYMQPDCVEDIFETIQAIITKVRETESTDKQILIVVDSLSASPSRREVEGDYGKDGYATDKAIVIGKAMRKITQMIAKQRVSLVFTNQLRQIMNAMPFGEKYVASGGMALPFHASVRIRLSVTGKITNKEKDVIGVSVKANVIKNRFGPPFRSTEFNIYFDRGIDDLDSWLDYCKAKEIVSGTSSLVYTDGTGTDHKFTSRDWKSLLVDNQSLKNEIYEKMGNAMIMAYSSENVTSEDVSIDPELE